MEISPGQLEDRSTQEIIDVLLQHVTKSEEELEKEKEEQRRQTTDLKVFIARKEGFKLGTIESRLQELATSPDTHDNTKDFIDKHGFSERPLNDDTSYFEIRTPSFERTDQFILVDAGEYIRTLTLERRYWTKRTIERIIDYLPELSQLYLTADDIGGIVDNLNDITETNVSGFTSKYRSYNSDRRLSIQFHGGDWKDIQHVEDEFGAKPTRVEFRQKNSPTDAVSGSITRDARINVPGIRAGSEDLGARTVNSVATEFEHLDQQHFEIPNTPTIQSTDSGLVIEGFTTLRLEEGTRPVMPDGGEGEDRSFTEALKEEILHSKRRYDCRSWNENDFLILDKERSEMLQVGVDDRDLVVNARPGTTPITLKEFCRIILEEFRTTYGISQRTTNLANPDR